MPTPDFNRFGEHATRYTQLVRTDLPTLNSVPFLSCSQVGCATFFTQSTGTLSSPQPVNHFNVVRTHSKDETFTSGFVPAPKVTSQKQFSVHCFIARKLSLFMAFARCTSAYKSFVEHFVCHLGPQLVTV